MYKSVPWGEINFKDCGGIALARQIHENLGEIIPKIFDDGLPDKRIINDDACILFFGEDKYIVKRMDKDEPDPEKAFLTAYFLAKSGLSRTKANKYLEKIREENSKVKKIRVKKG